ncbi:MAG: hypothetical protein HC812_01245 [Leptolyngbya sp. RL_3_1]|nr:hypothetical protein [Leptolyngbya sp. RL_3_1]
MTTVVVPSGETVAASGFVIYAKDYQRLVDFYAAMLQLQIIEREDDFCLIGGDRFELVIVQAPADIAKQISISHPPSAESIGCAQAGIFY